MKVALLFPPLWSPFQPYLSLPCLTAFLKREGYDVFQRDLNIEFYNRVLSRSFIQDITPQLYERLEDYENRDSIAYEEWQKYLNVAWSAKSNMEQLSESIEDAREYIKSSQSLSDIESYLRNLTIVRQALKLISVYYTPVAGFSGFASTGSPLEAFNSDCFFENPEENPFLTILEDLIVEDFRSNTPDVVGISITGERQILPGLILAWLVKKYFRDSYVVVGGSIISRNFQELTALDSVFKWIDFIVLFEGETALSTLLQNLKAGKPLEDVPNIVYRGRNSVSKIRFHPCPQVDSLPFPDFQGLPLKAYLSPELVLPIYASRGCYWAKCTFCDMHYGQVYRARSAASVAENIQNLQTRYHCKHFLFADTCLPKDLLDKLPEEIADRGLEIAWAVDARFEGLLSNRTKVHELKSSGCKILYFGLESASERILGLMKKGISIENVQVVLENLRKAGLWSVIFVMFGFPSEKKTERLETIDFLRRNRDRIDSFVTSYFFFKQHSPLAMDPNSYEHHSVKREEDEKRHYLTSLETQDGPTGLTDEEYEQSTHRISQVYPFNNIYTSVPMEHLLILLSKYDSKKLFKARVEGSLYRIQNSFEHLDIREKLSSHLHLNTGVFLSSLSFDIFSPSSGKGSRGLKRQSSFVILDTTQGSLLRVNKVANDILQLCDGTRSIKQIYDILRENHPGVDFKHFLHFLLDNISRGILVKAPRFHRHNQQRTPIA